jgi:hypothetical protein
MITPSRDPGNQPTQAPGEDVPRYQDSAWRVDSAWQATARSVG